MIPALTVLATATTPAPLPVVSSAGVFDNNDRLVRTLWSAQTNDPRVANPAAAWDGTLDDLSVAPTGTYNIKVLTGSTSYTWDGVVGNSCPNHSPDATDNNLLLRYLQGTTVMWSMTITDAGDVFYCNAYHEKNSTVFFTTTSDMNHGWNPIYYPGYGVFGGTSGSLTWGTVGGGNNQYHYSCTDGSVAYLDASDVLGVVAITGSTKVQIMYSGDPLGRMAIYDNSGGVGNGFIVGMAVQRSGNFFFCSRPLAGQVWITNKTTGATVRKDTSFVSPGPMACHPSTGDLWIAYGPTRNTVEKILVDGSGNFTPTGMKIIGPGVNALAISPDGTMLLLLDGSTQQIRAYNTSDASVRTAWGNNGTLGQAGGYANGAAVTDDKFMFVTVATGLSSGGGSGLCFAPDGSFWLIDNGNYRHLHFSAGNSPTVIERTSYVPTVYSVATCRGDGTRVFGNFLEWQVDYSKPLDPANGSWTLVNNWSYGVDTVHFDLFYALRWVGVYGNGRTYAALYNSNNNHREIHELTPMGLRYTGKDTDNQNYIAFNMDLYSWDGVNTVYRNPFTGFDGSNNPTWAGDPLNVGGPAAGWVPLLTVGTLPTNFPDVGVGNVFWPTEPLANGFYPAFKFRPGDSGRNHLGGIDVTGAWRFNTHPETTDLRGGPGLGHLYFPDAPYFECGGGGTLNNYGGALIYLPGGTDVFTSFRGELWGGGQTNMWSHWHQSGLLVNRFGSVAPYFAASPLSAPAYWNGGHRQLPESGSSFVGGYGRAGNVTTPITGVMVGGKYYIYHGEEWMHSGVHRWTVSNLGSITLTNAATVNWNSGSYVPPTPDPTDMLAGLPFSTTSLPDNTAGWRRTPTTDVGPIWPPNNPNFTVWTNCIKADPRASPDLMLNIFYGSPIQVKKVLPRFGSGNWSMTITPSINGLGNWYKDFTPANETYQGLFLEIVDNVGRTILSLFPWTFTNFVFGAFGNSVWANEKPTTDPAVYDVGNVWRHYRQGGYHSFPIYDGSQQHYLRDIVINANVGANQLTVTYGDGSRVVTPYDPLANIAMPFEFQMNTRFLNTPDPVNCSFALYQLRFVG